jgi:NAD(P)-dependent dehydrogenase (short-subunit alcohol dehydrogenase family)
MPEPRSVVITGASRGLGLASAAHLYRRGWHIVAAMRSPDAGLARLRAATGADVDDGRLTAVALDLEDPTSIVGAAKGIVEAVGAPSAVVHNAGLAAFGCVEEMPSAAIEQIFCTNVLGPIRLTAELLPFMRLAGKGRIVVVSSQGGLRGMPGISAYSASKGALERWAEALGAEVAPFGLGVTVLIAGTFRTDMLELTKSYADPDGPYATEYAALDRTGGRVVRFANPPERFAAGLARALDDDGPFTRRAIGTDARLMLTATRLLPGRVFQAMARAVMGLPRTGSLRGRSVS